VVALSLVTSALLAVVTRRSLARRLRTISAVLAAYCEGDFSIRARHRRRDGLNDVIGELNTLGDILREQRLGELEAWALLRKVLAEVDVVVLAFDQQGRVRLANDAAARLLGQPATTLVGEHAQTLELESLLSGEVPRTISTPLSIGPGPWELRRGAFRLVGEPHTLLVVSDVRTALRDKEREAWRRLIRVIGHEINNSLAPIHSVSDSLLKLIEQAPNRPEWAEDVVQGLGVVSRRAEALGRFTASYAALARLPAPRLSEVNLSRLVRRVAALEHRTTVEVIAGPEVNLTADADQLEQVLINLVKNATEACAETDGKVQIGWTLPDRFVEITVEDEGPGVNDTTNLFVPFFTTKPDGTGIGLVLSRQIVEAHRGELSLTSEPGRPGAIARVRLPTRFNHQETPGSVG